MRKRKKGRKFHREKKQRKALFKSLTTALILHKRIKTTEDKAKELRGFIEKQISLAKKGGIARRRLSAKILAPRIVKKLFDEIGPQYKERQGGYTRIVRLGRRLRDGAKMAIIELV